MAQLNLRQTPAETGHAFPPTRYQGSKRKLADAIVEELGAIDYHTVLDAFGGSGAVAYAFKRAAKDVTYNDVLAFNHQIGIALIENSSVLPAPTLADAIAARAPGAHYDDFIARTFRGIYFTDDENTWLDVAVANVRRIADRYHRALAWFAVIQAAIAKRPYNLFHRRNLSMRTADVPRSFGNKASWDRSFDDHVRTFLAQAGRAVFDSGVACRALCHDVFDVPGQFDLVYIDPPYLNRAGTGVDYRDFYHFLEGMVRYDDWPEMIDRSSKHLRLSRREDPWLNPDRCCDMYRRLFDRFRASTLVVSYRSDGTPAIDQLEAWLRDVKPRVRVVTGRRHQYALSTKRDTRQVLLIAEKPSAGLARKAERAGGSATTPGPHGTQANAPSTCSGSSTRFPEPAR